MNKTELAWFKFAFTLRKTHIFLFFLNWWNKSILTKTTSKLICGRISSMIPRSWNWWLLNTPKHIQVCEVEIYKLQNKSLWTELSISGNQDTIINLYKSIMKCAHFRKSVLYTSNRIPFEERNRRSYNSGCHFVVKSWRSPHTNIEVCQRSNEWNDHKRTDKSAIYIDEPTGREKKAFLESASVWAYAIIPKDKR